jgi:hypothetical protein
VRKDGIRSTHELRIEEVAVSGAIAAVHDSAPDAWERAGQ